MKQTDIINHFKDAKKAYDTNNANFIFSLYAGYELMIRHLYKTNPNLPLFRKVEPKYLIPTVGTRITERHDINMSFVRNVNNTSKHYKYQDKLFQDFKVNKNKIWHRYFVEMNKLFLVLRNEYHYDLGFSFQLKQQPKQPNNSSIPKGSTAKKQPPRTSQQAAYQKGSPFDIFIQKETDSRPYQYGYGDTLDRFVKERMQQAGPKLRNRISHDIKTQKYTIHDKARGQRSIFLDQNCRVEYQRLRNGNSLFSQIPVYAVFDEGNRLIFWGTEDAKRMSRYLSDIVTELGGTGILSKTWMDHMRTIVFSTFGITTVLALLNAFVLETPLFPIILAAVWGISTMVSIGIIYLERD